MRTARTSSPEAVAGSRTLGMSGRSHSRKLSSETKAPTTSSSLSHDRCPTKTVGGWTSSGKGLWSSGSMRRRRLQAQHASLPRCRNSAVARRTEVEVILQEGHDSKQFSMDEGAEEGVSAHGRT